MFSYLQLVLPMHILNTHGRHRTIAYNEGFGSINILVLANSVSGPQIQYSCKGGTVSRFKCCPKIQLAFACEAPSVVAPA